MEAKLSRMHARMQSFAHVAEVVKTFTGTPLGCMLYRVKFDINLESCMPSLNVPGPIRVRLNDEVELHENVHKLKLSLFELSAMFLI